MAICEIDTGMQRHYIDQYGFWLIQVMDSDTRLELWLGRKAGEIFTNTLDALASGIAQQVEGGNPDRLMSIELARFGLSDFQIIHGETSADTFTEASMAIRTGNKLFRRGVVHYLSGGDARQKVADIPIYRMLAVLALVKGRIIEELIAEKVPEYEVFVEVSDEETGGSECYIIGKHSDTEVHIFPAKEKDGVKFGKVLNKVLIKVGKRPKEAIIPFAEGVFDQEGTGVMMWDEPNSIGR